MAEEVKQYQQHVDEPCAQDATAVNAAEEGAVEAKDRGLFDFKGKKAEEKKVEEEVIVTEFEQKVQVCEPDHKEEEEEEEKKHESILEKLHRTGSSSSSSSDEEEVEEGGEKIKKKKKKGLKEKFSGEHKEEHKAAEISVPVEKYEESEEKKGFLDKIKEKLPGGNKKAEEVSAPPPPHQATECATPDVEAKEKKGFLDKIKEKLPGYHPKTEEEKEKEKEKEKEGAYH